VYASIAVDGIAFGQDGTLFAAVEGGGVAKITATNSPTPGAVSIIDTPFGSGDGIALSATPGTPFLYINRNDGIITKIDVTTTPPTFTDIFSGGSRGDFAAVGPDGCLYATQTDRVIKVSNADGTCLPPPLGPLVPTTPPPPLPPVANAGGPYAANECAAVAFNGSGSSDAGGLALTYSWDFGDGSPAATGATPTHTYADNRSTPYTVTLTVTNAGSLSNVASTTATISNVAPSVSPISGATIVAGQSFISSGSFADPGQDTWTATVSYGDGSGTQALALSGKTFQLSHLYGTAGTYSVTVTVTDDDGAPGVGQATVIVRSAQPQQALRALISTIRNLVTSGLLSAGNGNALSAKLQAAISELNVGNNIDALNELKAFINQVKALMRAGRLPAGEGQNLIDAANQLIRVINTP